MLATFQRTEVWSSATRELPRGPGLRIRGFAAFSYRGTAYFDYAWESRRTGLALTLLVAWVLADHHDATIAADYLALVADRLHAWVNLQGLLLLRLQLFVEQ